MNLALLAKPSKALIIATSLIAASSVLAYAADVTVPLGAQANTPLANPYVTPPTGLALLGGHTFDLTSGNYVSINWGQSLNLTGSYSNANAVFVLMNSYYTDLHYAGATVGQVQLTFSDGSTQSTALVEGLNIREWRPAGSNTVNTATGPGWSNVWTGMATPPAGGGTAVIDMLTLTVSTAGKTLTGISVTNTLAQGNALGFILSAVTVDDAPVVIKPSPTPTPTPTPTKKHDPKHHQTKAPVKVTCAADKDDTSATTKADKDGAEKVDKDSAVKGSSDLDCASTPAKPKPKNHPDD